MKPYRSYSFYCMKYSQLIGIFCCLSLVAVCTLPWSYVPGIDITLSGINGYVNDELNFGKQIIVHSFFSAILILFFLLPKIWAKRSNIFIAAVNLALAIKNSILFTFCREGICPEKRAGIFLLVITCALIQAMTFFPKMTITEKNDF